MSEVPKLWNVPPHKYWLRTISSTFCRQIKLEKVRLAELMLDLFILIYLGGGGGGRDVHETFNGRRGEPIKVWEPLSIVLKELHRLMSHHLPTTVLRHIRYICELPKL
jgi:hypothetical protein